MGSSSGVTDSEGDTLRQRNVMDSQQKEVEPQDDSGPTQDGMKCKKTIGRTPDGAGEFIAPFQLEALNGPPDK